MAESWWQKALKGVTPILGATARTFRELATETMEEAQQRVHETTRTVIKSLVIFFIFAFGLVYFLTGFGKFLEQLYGLLPGTGGMIIGLVFILLGVFAVAIRR